MAKKVFTDVNVISASSVTPPYSFVGSTTTGMYAKSAAVFTGAASGLISTPDAAALDIANDIDMRLDLSVNNWRAGTNQILWSKNDSLNVTNGGYAFLITSGNALTFQWGTGAAQHSIAANVPTTWANNSRRIIRAAVDINDGSGNRVATLYWSDDGGVTWNVLLTTTTAGTSSIANVSQGLRHGMDIYGNNRLTGKIYRGWLYDGIGGTLVANPMYEDIQPGTTSFTDSTGKVYTITAPASIATDNTVGFVANSFNTMSVLPTGTSISGELNVNNSAVYTNASSPIRTTVRVATTATGTLATAYENGDSVDGVTLATGDRILIKNQSSASENGIYIVQASGAPVRAADFDSISDMPAGVMVGVLAGTTNAASEWMLTSTVSTLETSSVTFTQLLPTFPLLTPNGTAGAPSYSFSGDPDTGIFQTGTANNLGISAGGTVRLTISDTIITAALPFRGASGLATAPTYSFTSGNDMGMYRNGTGDLRLVAAGSGAGTPAQMAIVDDTTDGTISLFAKGSGTVRTLVGLITKWSTTSTEIVATVPNRGANGSVSAPTYSFTNDTGSGLWLNALGDMRTSVRGNQVELWSNDGAGNIGWAGSVTGTGTFAFAAGGFTRLTIGPSDVTLSSAQLLTGNGTSSNPTHSFTNDTDTGWFLNAVGDMQLVVAGASKLIATDDGTNGSSRINGRGTGAAIMSHGGTSKVTVTANDISLAIHTLGPDGSAGTPTYSWTNSATTGFFRSAADVVGVSVAGTEKFTFGASGMNAVDAITVATDHDVQVMDWMSVNP